VSGGTPKTTPIGRAGFKVELHLVDIARVPEALRRVADLCQPLELLVPLMFEELLELMLGDRSL
jgi:hypothetical protein